MKFLKVFFALSIGWLSIAYAGQADFEKQYVKPLTIKIYSNNKGFVKEEHFRCTPETCCFSQKFYCFMEHGRCICDLYVCDRWPKNADEKIFWMELIGTEAERVCGRPRPLHEVTNLCLCNPDKNPPCNECNRPATSCPHPGEGLSLPPDCRHH